MGHQAPLSMEFSRQEYWSEVPLPPLGDLPNPGIEPGSPALQADSLSSEPPGKPWVLLLFEYGEAMLYSQFPRERGPVRKHQGLSCDKWSWGKIGKSYCGSQGEKKNGVNRFRIG